MEEIDIIELLKRVKEGKAPKKIEILGNCYIRNTDEDKDILDYMYKGNIDYWTCETQVDIDTKIKILDKPKYQIITKISDDWDYDTVSIYDLCAKVDEVIGHINNKENNNE